MKKIIIFVFLAFFAFTAKANDGVYFTSGNQLIPLVETQISVAKEILTISLKDDGTADVDVYYEFMNNGEEKDVLMGFEANAPYNAGKPVNDNGVHPFIRNFSVVMNNQSLQISNGIVVEGIENGIHELDRKLWRNDYDPDNKGEDIMDDALYNAELDSIVSYSYVYKFNAHFKKGKNIVHHTYNYNMGYGVSEVFNLDYKLSPATRWANHQIDDFTLVIKAENTAKHFLIGCGIPSEKELHKVGGSMKCRKASGYYDDHLEVTLRNGAVEWHKNNYAPTQELSIISADAQYWGEEYKKLSAKEVLALFYDRSINYNSQSMLMRFGHETEPDARILRNMAYAHRGYVFKAKDLQELFNRQWWYMPDNNWKASTEDFTQKELEYLK